MSDTNESNAVYDPAKGHMLMQACTLAYLDFGDQPADKDGYITLQSALDHITDGKGQPITLQQVIKQADIGDAAAICDYLNIHDQNWNSWKIKVIEKALAKALVFKQETAGGCQEAIVSFRGTQPTSIRQWLADDDATLVDFTAGSGKRCMAHEGYVHQVYGQNGNGIHTDIQAALQAMPCDQLSITGHSMGAAMASIFALGLEPELGKKIQEVYGFAPPRSGDQAFAEIADQEIPQYFHVRTYRDIVPFLPPEDFGFANSGIDIHLDENGKPVHDLQQNKRLEELADLNLTYDLESHQPDVYLKMTALAKEIGT